MEFVEVTGLWKLGGQEKKFRMNFQAVVKAGCECFRQNFTILNKIITNGDN